MGLGLLGRGVGDAKFLAEQGAELIVTDLKGDDALRTSLDELKSFPNVRYRLGGHDLADFRDRDFILKAAGVPLDSPFIAEAKKNKIPIKMSASWFAELAGIPIVGVTGTRGKTTTTYMLDAIMRANGMHVLLGGNIRGVSTLALLPQVTPTSVGLFELDSWQCQGFGDEALSPHVAVFTTFLDDHLSYYHNDRDLYFLDKAQIFLSQKPDDVLVVSAQVAPFVKKYKDNINSKIVIAEPKNFPNDWKLGVQGGHNVLNAMCAVEAARALGIDDSVMRSALAEFKGVEGRLELIREVRGVKIYNDTTATTPDATLVALDVLHDSGHSQNVILIMGGADKGLDMSVLLPRLPSLKRVILLSGSGTDLIMGSFPTAPVYERLDLAVQDAMEFASQGDVVLLSPAFSSKGMFANEYDRGDQFNALVRAL